MQDTDFTDTRQSSPELRRALPAALLGVLLALGCGGADAPSGAAEGGTGSAGAAVEVRPGIEVLLSDSTGLVAGRRAGLITNHTGITSEGRSTIDALAESEVVELVALFSPEHGIRGAAEAGEKVTSGLDERTGLPVHSLYGEIRKPTPEMLEGIEVLLFDIQDIGARYYTYVSTMALGMEAAAEEGIPFVVLDRPNPIGGRHVQGNVLEPEHATFVGMYPVPMRHGMTPGELARLFNEEFGIGAELSVAPAAGWTRDRWFDETDLPWVRPSPNMPDLESATHYPGTCLFEGTNLSVGRGTEAAFQQIGAPWLDNRALVRALEAHDLPGVRFEAVTFTPEEPGDRKYGGEAVAGVRLHVTDREAYDPAVAGVALLVESRRLAGDRWEWKVAHFDRLAGTTRLREAVEAGRGLGEIVGPWEDQIASFEALRAPYLIYPEGEE